MCGHFGKADGVNRSHADRAFHFPFQRLQSRVKLFLAPQHVPAESVIEPPGRRESERAGGTVEQQRVQLPLEFLQVLAGCRLRNAAQRRAFADALVLHQVLEQLNMIEAHVCLG